MSELLARLRATYTAAFLFLYLYVVGPPFVLHAWVTHRIDRLYRMSWWAAWLGLRLAGVRYTVTGEEHLPRERPCVYMANHQSNADPPLLFVVLPPRIALMGKRQVFSIPLLGTVLRLADCVPVNREERQQACSSVEEALGKLQRGISFLVFPEGTRSPDGRLQRFKHGVFLLALRAGATIVPITVDGAAAIMPKGKWEIRPGLVRLTIHPPVETRRRSPQELHLLAKEVRARVASALPEDLRGDVATAGPEKLDDSF